MHRIRALQEFVARHSPGRVTEVINRVIDEVGGGLRQSAKADFHDSDRFYFNVR